MPTIDEARAIIPDLATLTDDQFAWIKQLVQSMSLPTHSKRNPLSDVFPDDRKAGLFLLYLITHHVLSSEPFKKEKFEYALEKIMVTLGRTAERPRSRTNRGHDLTVNGERWSCKSEAHRGIKPDQLWISKWMELGKGQWGDDENDLRNLCASFLHHLKGYDRVFTLRCLTAESRVDHHYELLEIPKQILLHAKTGEFVMM